MKKFIGIFALLFLFSVGLVTAATVTISSTEPAANAQMAGVVAPDAFVNVTVDKSFMVANGNETPVCVATLAASGNYLSANTTRAVASTKFTNHSEYDFHINLSQLATFEDGQYSLIVNCGNQTVASTNTTSTARTVYVDHSIPQIPTAMTPATGTESTTRTQTFAWTVEGNDTTQCILSFADSAIRPGTGIYLFAPSGNTCSKTIDIAGGRYTFKGGASDETNTTYTATSELIMSSSKSGGVSYVPSGDGDKSNIVIIVLVAGAAFLLFGKKGK